MSIAKRPSQITLPSKNNGWDNILEFLVEQFPLIKREIWVERLKNGKVHWHEGEKLTLETKFVASKKLCYYREVEQEPSIPFQHKLLYQNEHFAVVCKPHYLPVTPGGKYVNECLLERLRADLNCDDLVPLHRLDRETAGLVLFSVNKSTRGLYAQLFQQQKITKKYQAIALIEQQNSEKGKTWTIENRLVKSAPRFLMEETEGEVNACSIIKLIDIKSNLGQFELKPITGKTHQLRLHMMKIGSPILNDKFYPELLAEVPENYQTPLQLLAKKISFIDPLTSKQYHFESERQLSAWVGLNKTSLKLN